jgi:hypothetical protein
MLSTLTQTVTPTPIWVINIQLNVKYLKSLKMEK